VLSSRWLALSCALAGSVCVWGRSDTDATDSINALNSQIVRAPQAPGAEALLRKRLPLLQALIRSNPDRALSLAFSDETIARLRSADSSPDAQVESRGRWEGMAFPLVEDSRDRSYSRTYLRMHSSEGDLDIYPGQGSAPIPPGARRYRVEGVRAGKNVAAANILPLNPAAAAALDAATWLLAVRAGGNAGALARYERELGALADWAACEGAEQDSLWELIVNYTPGFLATNRTAPLCAPPAR